MPLARSHGRTTPECPRSDELAQPVNAALPHRDANGRLLPGEATRAMGARAGRQSRALAKAQALAMDLLGLRDVGAEHAWHPYQCLAKRFRTEQCARLAAGVGGGELDPSVLSLIASAALQLAQSRYFADRGVSESADDLILQSARLADASRQNLVTASDMAARDAASRPKPMSQFLQDTYAIQNAERLARAK